MNALSDAEIKSFLENSSIYAWREFLKPKINRSDLQIREIDSFCEVCNQDRPFQDLRSRGGGARFSVDALKSGMTYFEFTCASCRKARRIFHVEQVVSETTIKLQKFGEHPRRKLSRDPILQKFFADDLANYEKAIVCLSNEYGIAAFAYFRRITEDNVFRLLDLLQEDAVASGSDPVVKDALSSLRKESPMSERIRLANLALPVHLKPDGLNPLGRIYQVLSEGIHSLSDQECLERARTISECLIYLVTELASRKAHRARFKSLVGKLNESVGSGIGDET